MRSAKAGSEGANDRRFVESGRGCVCCNAAIMPAPIAQTCVSCHYAGAVRLLGSRGSRTPVWITASFDRRASWSHQSVSTASAGEVTGLAPSTDVSVTRQSLCICAVRSKQHGIEEKGEGEPQTQSKNS